MQSAWRVVDCTQLDGSITYKRGRMVVSNRDSADVTVAEVPLSQIAVLLIGQRIYCSSAVLFELAQYGVSVMLCDWRGVPVAAVHPWTDLPTTVTQRQLAQSRMSVPRRKNAWARIVQAKIRGQAACLDSLHREGSGILRGLAASVRSGDPSNIEGQAAREYWKRLFGDEERFKRVPRQGIGRNAQLDYAYSVLRGFAVKSVVSAGLAPPFGVNHHGRGNYFCLVDDLIEPFRAAIDYRVASSLDSEDTVADRSTKKILVEASNQQFDSSGLTIPSALNDFAQQFGMYCEGRIDRLHVPTYGGPDAT